MRSSRDVVVTGSSGAKAADAAAIAAGIPSRALMQRAGAATAAEICHRFADRLADGVLVATGSGNNGGDGWVIANSLHAAGVRVRVVECAQARTPDAITERQSAIDAGVVVETGIRAMLTGGESIVVDALLGTGLRFDEPLERPLADGVAALHALQRRGAQLVAVDVPSGVDATAGMHVGAARCALTVTYGTLKRAHLMLRDVCGVVVLVDIGLGPHAANAGSMHLATRQWFDRALPPIHASSHKGTRKKIAIIGGGEGMAGAVILAARAALRSGAGMVKCVVAGKSQAAVQEAEPAALSAPWPETDEEMKTAVGDWADCVLIGPGLGRASARTMVERLARMFTGSLVIDADALNAFAGDPDAIAGFAADREVLLTPHPQEFARLSGLEVDEVLERRFDVPAELAQRTRATVLLKGVPTTIARPDGKSMAVAEGTPILATGGAGDVLGGIAATLLAQTRDALTAGALAAFAHGRAAYRVSDVQVRGFTLDDVLAKLPDVWVAENASPRAPILIELPRVGEQP